MIKILLNEPLLGKVPDRIIAEKHSTSIATVSYARRKLKIGASHYHVNPHARKVPFEKIFPLLGKRSDADLGRLYGLTRERIRQIRKQLGIPKYSKSREAA